jgi:hypothetical protein
MAVPGDAAARADAPIFSVMDAVVLGLTTRISIARRQFYPTSAVDFNFGHTTDTSAISVAHIGCGR